MKRALKMFQTGFFYFLAVSMMATGYASGCTASFNSRDNNGDEETARTSTGGTVIVRNGEQVHP